MAPSTNRKSEVLQLDDSEAVFNVSYALEHRLCLALRGM